MIGNIFAPIYYKYAAKAKLWVARDKEQMKKNKYANRQDIYPLAMETTGGTGRIFRGILKSMAHRIGTRKQVPFEIESHRIKVKLIATLMKEQANMIISSMM